MTPINPSPEEIKAACERIRAAWSEAELRKRAAWGFSEPVTAAVVGDEEVGE